MKIAIIGSGNVATHLTEAFSAGPHLAVSVSSRTFDGLPTDADLYLICVSDKAIEEVSGRLGPVAGVVAHTSGSVDIGVLSGHSRRGVWYPMQTFSKGDKIDYRQIPVFVEASGSESMRVLRQAAEDFSDTVVEADSSQRKALHIAAVFACNFTNRLYAIADDILNDAGLNFKLMLPLIHQAVNKLHRLSPDMAQTGPASRGDFAICESHLGYLADKPEVQTIYRLISDSIARHRAK